MRKQSVHSAPFGNNNSTQPHTCDVLLVPIPAWNPVVLVCPYEPRFALELAQSSLARQVNVGYLNFSVMSPEGPSLGVRRGFRPRVGRKGGVPVRGGSSEDAKSAQH